VTGLIGAGLDEESLSKGFDRCRRGLGRSGVGDNDRVPSSLAAAVLGRTSVVLGLHLCSLAGGLEAEMIEDKLPETECPGRTVVPELSLDTSDRGRGINCMSSENPTRARLEAFCGELWGELVSGLACLTSLVDACSIPGNGERECSLPLGLQGAELPRGSVYGSLGFKIKLRS